MSNAKEYYNRTSRNYVEKWRKIYSDPNNPSSHFRLKLIRSLIEMAGIRPGEKVIEIGCGTGLVLKELLNYVKPVYGIDISVEMLRRVQDSILRDRKVVIVKDFKEIKESQLGPEAILLEGDILDLNLPRGYFDKILSLEVFRYIKDTRRALSNIAEIMKPESTFVFTVTNQWSVNLFPIRFLIRKWLGLVDPNKEIFQYFTTEGLIKKAIKEAGLEVIEFRKIDKRLRNIPVLRFFFDTFVIAVKKVA